MAELMNILKTSEIIDRLVEIDREKKQLANNEKLYKAELQKRGLRYTEDKNIKHKIYTGTGTNRAEFVLAQKIDIINWYAFKDVMGDMAKEKVKRLISYSYKWDSKLEAAVKAMLTDDYNSEMTLEELIRECFDADSKQVSLLVKGLKGDCKRDREQLTAIFELPSDADLDVELDYIHKIINWAKIKMFIPDNTEQTIASLKKCITVTSTPKLTVRYGDVNE